MKYFISILAIFLFSTQVDAQRNRNHNNNRNQDWKFIADKDVNFGLDHDVINFGSFKDDFRRLKLHVTDAPLHISAMRVHFDNGSVQEVELKNNFRQGDWSRIIDLDGGMRHLRQVEFWYSTNGILKGKARVAVWGSK